MILTILGGYAGGIWFLADMSSAIEDVAKTNVSQDVRIDRVETDTRSLQIGAATIVEQLSGLTTSISELKQETRETNQLLRQLIQPAP